MCQTLCQACRSQEELSSKLLQCSSAAGGWGAAFANARAQLVQMLCLLCCSRCDGKITISSTWKQGFSDLTIKYTESIIRCRDFKNKMFGFFQETYGYLTCCNMCLYLKHVRVVQCCFGKEIESCGLEHHESIPFLFRQS